jgi:hypothetical protein
MMREMPRPLFPQRRDDGTFSVGIKYRVPADDPGVIDSIREALAQWLQKKTDVHHVDMQTEFSEVPYIEVDESGDVLVVLNGLRTSYIWKGLMAEVFREMESINRAELAGVLDLVTGRPHPASISWNTASR